MKALTLDNYWDDLIDNLDEVQEYFAANPAVAAWIGLSLFMMVAVGVYLSRMGETLPAAPPAKQQHVVQIFADESLGLPPPLGPSSSAAHRKGSAAHGRKLPGLPKSPLLGKNGAAQRQRRKVALARSLSDSEATNSDYAPSAGRSSGLNIPSRRSNNHGGGGGGHAGGAGMHLHPLTVESAGRHNGRRRVSDLGATSAPAEMTEPHSSVLREDLETHIASNPYLLLDSSIRSAANSAKAHVAAPVAVKADVAEITSAPLSLQEKRQRFLKRFTTKAGGETTKQASAVSDARVPTPTGSADSSSGASAANFRGTPQPQQQTVPLKSPGRPGARSQLPPLAGQPQRSPKHSRSPAGKAASDGRGETRSVPTSPLLMERFPSLPAYSPSKTLGQMQSEQLQRPPSPPLTPDTYCAAVQGRAGGRHFPTQGLNLFQPIPPALPQQTLKKITSSPLLGAFSGFTESASASSARGEGEPGLPGMPIPAIVLSQNFLEDHASSRRSGSGECYSSPTDFDDNNDVETRSVSALEVDPLHSIFSPPDGATYNGFSPKPASRRRCASDLSSFHFDLFGSGTGQSAVAAAEQQSSTAAQPSQQNMDSFFGPHAPAKLGPDLHAADNGHARRTSSASVGAAAIPGSDRQAPDPLDEGGSAGQNGWHLTNIPSYELF